MRYAVLLFLTLLLSSCHYRTEEMALYAVGDNFQIAADSMELQANQPLHNLPVDTLSERVCLYGNDPVVVAEIDIIPEDSLDSVWVKLARDQFTMGWTHQGDFLQSVVPPDPISRFIHLFSVTHAGIFAVIFVLALIILLSQRHQPHLFFLRDIFSFYPTLLILVFSLSALLYASIQHYAPETWTMYYYHPTLNPFDTPLILSLFLTSVWLLLVIGMATVNEVLRQLQFRESVLYLLSLLSCGIVCYVIFMLAAMSPVAGIILYALFASLLLTRYVSHAHPRYLCGHCGAKLHEKGICPRCGTLNT